MEAAATAATLMRHILKEFITDCSVYSHFHDHVKAQIYIARFILPCAFALWSAAAPPSPLAPRIAAGKHLPAVPLPPLYQPLLPLSSAALNPHRHHLLPPLESVLVPHYKRSLLLGMCRHPAWSWMQMCCRRRIRRALPTSCRLGGPAHHPL